MKKTIFALFMSFIAYSSYAQSDKVGINTASPNATLDIQANSPNSNDALEGILIPRVSKEKAYNMANGANSLDESTMIYVNDTTSTAFASGMPAELAKVEEINENGFYFWNGSIWVKAVSGVGAIWVNEIDAGDTLTYLKDAVGRGDTIMYSAKRGSYINLGQGDPTENIWSDGVTVGTPINEIPLLNVINSDALPINSTIGDANNVYNFSSNLSILKNSHASASATNTVSKSYDGFQSKLLISNDVTETLGTITGATSSSTNRGSGTINAMYGGRNFVVNGISGEPNTNVNYLTALNAVNINIGTTNEMTGVSSVISNRGTANKIFGANIITRTQSPQNEVIAAHSINQVKGIRNAMNITENATVTSNEAYGIENIVVVESNTSTKNVTAGMNRLFIDAGAEIATNNRGFGSYSEVRIKDEFISNDFWGARNTFNLETDNAKARNVLLNESVLYSSGENTSITGSIFGYKFWNPNSSNYVADRIYGMFIGALNNGTTSNYGVYVENIGNPTATDNYSIYTNAGKVSLGDSLQVRNINSTSSSELTDKIVVADADGVLKTTAQSIAELGSKWTNDSAESAAALSNLSDGTTARPLRNSVTFFDSGSLRLGYDTTFANVDIEGNPIDPNDPDTDGDKGITVNLYDGSGVIAIDGRNYMNQDSTSFAMIQAIDNRAPILSVANSALQQQWNISATTGNNGLAIQETTSGSTALFMDDSGNVGINNFDPQQKLDISGNIRVRTLPMTDGNYDDKLLVTSSIGTVKSLPKPAGELLSKWTNDTINTVIKLTNLSDGVTARADAVNIFIEDNGKVGIGTNSSDEKLHVNGNVKATTFIATNTGSVFPDYVFEKYYKGESELNEEYEFKSLEEVEQFTKENGHLPGYASAKEVAKAGQINMTATQLTNVEKIEELYLHTIEQEKRIKEKDAKIADLESRLERLEKLLLKKN